MVPRAQRDHFFRKVSYYIYFSYPQIHDVFADDLFGVSHNALQLQDVGRSAAQANVPQQSANSIPKSRFARPSTARNAVSTERSL